ncbi:MAG: hypothetical protein ABIH46_07950 [Chloroflexota bacterium]
MKKWAFAALVVLIELTIVIMVLANIVPSDPTMPMTSGARYAEFFGDEQAADASVTLIRWLVYLVTIVVLLSAALTMLLQLMRWGLNRRWRTHG